jgi:hypothetical protein
MVLGDLTAKPVKDQTTQRVLHHHIAHFHLLLGLLQDLDLDRGQDDKAGLLHQLLELFFEEKKLGFNSLVFLVSTHIFRNVLINFLDETLVVIDAR